MSVQSRSQRGPFLCLLLSAGVVPLVPVALDAPVDKQLLFAGLALLGALLLGLHSLRGRLAPTLGTPTDLAVLGFLACTLPSVVTASRPAMAWHELGNLTCLGLTYVLAVKTLRQPRDVLLYFGVVLAGALVMSAQGLRGYRNFLAAGAPELARSDFLSTPYFPHSYLAAQYLVLVLTGGLVLVIEPGLPRRWRAALAVLLLPVGLFLLTIGSRGGYLAVGLALIGSAALRAGGDRPGSRSTRLLVTLLAAALALAAAVLLALLLAAVGLLPDEALQNALARMLLFFDPRQSQANFERLDVWRDTLAMASDHVLTGVGPGGFAYGILPYQTASRLVPHAHNQFLQVFAQSGLIGLVGLVFLVKTGVHTARRASHHLATDVAWRGCFHAAVAALLAALVYFLLETPLHWIEAGSLIMVLLAIMSRAGCDRRDAVPAAGAAVAGWALPAAVLALALPAWLAYDEQAGDRVAAHAVVLSADEAAAAGNEDRSHQLFEESNALLVKADARSPYTLDVITQASDQAWDRGELECALGWLRLGQQRFPGAPFQLFKLGSLQLELGRAAHAIGPLRAAALRLGDELRPLAEAQLGRAYARTQQFEEAWRVHSALADDQDFVEQAPEILLEAVTSLLMLQRELALGHALLERYLALDPAARDDEHYLELRDRLEKQRTQTVRLLWRGASWAGWIQRLPPAAPAPVAAR